MRSKSVLAILGSVAVMLGASGCSPSAEESFDGTTLSFETWRIEDVEHWEQNILPVFYEAHPDIRVSVDATNNNEYGSAVEARLQSDTAGDLITRVPYVQVTDFVGKGFLQPITEVEGLADYSEPALEGFAVDGSAYCVPLASVGAAFYYNKAIFEELGLEVPTTQREFVALLETVQDDGTYTPIIFAGDSADSWSVDQMGFENLGPNYWGGDAGRLSIEDGTKQLTDAEYVNALAAMNEWAQFFPEGYEGIGYRDARQAFTMGQVAVYPGGSFDINEVSSAGVDVGVFAAPTAEEGDEVYTQMLPDHGLCLNAKSENVDAAVTFLQWLTTDEFAELYANALPGFFPLKDVEVELDNPVAQEFIDLRTSSTTAVPIGLSISSGSYVWREIVGDAAQKMLTGGSTPEEAAAEIQKTLEEFYEPQMNG